MATAAAPVRCLLGAGVTVHSTSTATKEHSFLFSLSLPLAPSTIRHLQSKTLTLKPSFVAKPLISGICPSSFAAYAETEEEGGGYGEAEEEEGEEEVAPPPMDGEGRLYVGNLPYSFTSHQLAELFSQAGTVESVEIVYDRVTDRSRGFGFVGMASINEAATAIRMFNGTQVGGRTVKVNFPEVPRGGEREVMGPRTRATSRGYVDSAYKVYAGNLGWSVTSESLRDAFSDQPGLLGAKVIYDRESGRSRGFGFLSFESPEDAESAIERMNRKEVDGRPLRLNIAAERPSASTTTL